MKRMYEPGQRVRTPIGDGTVSMMCSESTRYGLYYTVRLNSGRLLTMPERCLTPFDAREHYIEKRTT